MTPQKIEVVVLGCGTSSSVPSIKCLLSENPCNVCLNAHQVENSRNRRLNPSLLVLTPMRRAILIDCGKTFRESILRWFPDLGINSIDAVLLTHDHADACLGIDDLRDLQRSSSTIMNDKTMEKMRIPDKPLPIYLSERTRDELIKKFNYLNSSSVDKTEMPYRWTTSIDWNIIKDYETIPIEEMYYKALPVIHGSEYIAYGFEFGAAHGFRFVYLSDVSEIPEKTMNALALVLLERNYSLGKLDILMIDAIFTTQVHGTHFNLPQALNIVRKLQPKKTYLTGMSHDFDYYENNAQLQLLKHEQGIDVEMAYDGMRLEFPW